MKKVFTLATAVLLMTGFAFAQTVDKKKSGKSCCKDKDGKECKKTEKKKMKETKTTAKVVTKKA